jgi:enoyl-CoA hydratase/carnithine racemase
LGEYANLLVERACKDDKVLVVKVNRPPVNALNRETVASLQGVFTDHKGDDSVGCVVVTGGTETKTPMFIAGADIQELASLNVAGASDLSEKGQFLMRTIGSFPKPVIAAINGPALGGGCETAMMCDIRLIAGDLTDRNGNPLRIIGQPEVRLGIIPGYLATQRLITLVGEGMAKQLILSGESITAKEAHRIHLVDQVYPADKLMDEALKLADLICSNGPLAVMAALECINAVNTSEGGNLERRRFSTLFGTRQAAEGLKAFTEKRKPVFEAEAMPW